MQQPTKRKVQFAFAAAVLISISAIFYAVVAIVYGPRWQFINAGGFGVVAALWWYVAFTWNKRAA